MLTVYNEKLVLAFEFRRQHELSVSDLSRERLGLGGESLLEIELSLVHEDLEGAHLVLPKVDGWLGHVGIDDLTEERNVALSVDADTLDEVGVLGCVEILLQVGDLNVD
jgi:hypothetical protein